MTSDSGGVHQDSDYAQQTQAALDELSQMQRPSTSVKYAVLGRGIRFGRNNHFMLLQAAFARVRLFRQGILVRQLEIRTADPAFKRRLVLPGG